MAARSFNWPSASMADCLTAASLSLICAESFSRSAFSCARGCEAKKAQCETTTATESRFADKSLGDIYDDLLGSGWPRVNRVLWSPAESIAAGLLLRRGRRPPFLVAGVITASRARGQFAGALSSDTHLDVAERAVAVFVGWVIADDVLCAQVFRNLSGDGRYLVDVFRVVWSPARLVRERSNIFL